MYICTYPNRRWRTKARVAPGLPGVAGRGAGLLAPGVMLRAERKMGQQHRGGGGSPGMGLWGYGFYGWVDVVSG